MIDEKLIARMKAVRQVIGDELIRDCDNVMKDGFQGELHNSCLNCTMEDEGRVAGTSRCLFMSIHSGISKAISNMETENERCRRR